jgi:hypothetical protein
MVPILVKSIISLSSIITKNLVIRCTHTQS